MYFPTGGAGRQGANPVTILLCGVAAIGGPSAPGGAREPRDRMGEGMPK
jgi:hypothetical protein